MEYPIPAPSLQRLRVTYDQYVQLVSIIGEAIGLERIDGIDLPRGVLIVNDQPNPLEPQPMPEGPPKGVTDELLNGALAR